jgi:MFS family permease
MLWLVCFFNYADRQAIFSVFPKLESEFGFNPVQLGLIGSAFMWVYALGAPLAGYAGDRWLRKPLILGGCVVWSFVTMLTGSCSRFWHFMTVRGLEGLGETFYIPASTSLMSDYHGTQTRSRALGIHNSSVYLGTIAGGWLGAWFAVHSGWRSGFYVFGGAGILLALGISRYLREPVRGQSETEPTSANLNATSEAPEFRLIILKLFKDPTALLLMLAFVGANFVATIFLTWTPTFLVKKFGFQLTAAGLSGSVFIHLASALSVPFGGWLADHWARRRAGGRMLVQAVGLLTGAMFVFLVGTTKSASVLLFVMTIFGLCKGLYDSNIFASIFDVVEPRARATAAGIMNTVGWGGGALGPLAVGWFTKYGRHSNAMDNMSEAISSCSLLYLVSGILLLIAAARASRKPTVREPTPRISPETGP